MDISYLVSGNNLFGQWLLKTPVIDKFENLTNNRQMLASDSFIIKNAKLVDICWSYNVFQWQNDFYVSGAWGDEDDVIAKLNIYQENKLKDSEFLAVGNDFSLYIVNVKQFKIWVFSFGEKSTVYPINLDIKYPLEGPNQSLEFVKIIASNNSIFFLTNNGYVIVGMPPQYLDTKHCLGEICDISCGYEHCMLLTDAGRVYTLGCGQRLQLGHGDIEYVDKPKEVEALAGIRITKISAGGFHSLALSEFGDVYAWGWNDKGQLGVRPEDNAQNNYGPINYPLPKLVDIYEDERIVNINVVDIACGSRHSAIKLEDKTVYTSGYNKYGQLGLSPDKFPSVKYFRKVHKCNCDFKLMCGMWSTVLECKTKSSED